MAIVARATAWTFPGFPSARSSAGRLGTICQESPNGSVIQPHRDGLAPALTNYVPALVDLLLVLARDDNENPWAKLKCGPPL